MKTPKQEIFLGNYDLAVEARLNAWAEDKVCRRIWNKDGTVWVSNPVEAANTPELTNRLGWLTLAHEMHKHVDNLTDFAYSIRADGFEKVVLLGMGGSSLAPEVLMSIFGNADGFPSLIVLDSTNPEAVQAVIDEIDVAKTLFLVSSKSGGTVETLSFFKYFYQAVKEVKDAPGENFVAITDPGSKLEKIADEKAFRRVFQTPTDVGGRYSALTYFGLVPAVLIGMDLDKFLKRAMHMADECGDSVSATKNPALILGAALGELTFAAKDKLTFFTSPHLAPFGVWIEQLIAESTGKKKTGILPVVGEPLNAVANYGNDRVFVYLRLADDDNDILDKAITDLEEAGHPVVEISLNDKYDLAQEFFRWEMATAAAGAVLSINPFDQPNVEEAKIKARELMAAYQENGEIPADTTVLKIEDISLFGQVENAQNLPDAIDDFFAQIQPNNYLALMAYLPTSPEIDKLLEKLRAAWGRKLNIATTLGYGPRFLHSTGQLHKGGNGKGLFIQITHTPKDDIDVPDEGYSFGTLIAAQALGDYRALTERGRHIIRFHIDGDISTGLEKLIELI